LLRFTSATTKSSRSIGPLRYALAVFFALAFQAQASSITAFSLVFSLTNQSADGTGVGDALSLTLTGGNDGSGLAGTTDVLTASLADGTVNFDFSYSSLDAPGFDSAGYLLGGVFVQLADTDGESGSASFPVSFGESFGFRVATADNGGEPGILTITNLSAPGTSSIPEPGTLPLALAGTLAMGLFKGKIQRILQRGSGAQSRNSSS
jgi:hypothetical protein